MSEERIKVRVNRSVGEIELEGTVSSVAEWWGRIWPDLKVNIPTGEDSHLQPLSANDGKRMDRIPELFGEYFANFASGITDVDKVLVASVYVQERESDRTFSTKAANQLLLDQNIKVANASQNVRRLIQTKRAFVVADGKFRVSASGLDYLNSLKRIKAENN